MPNDVRMRWAPIAAALIVAVLYAAIACTADSELGARDPKDAYYNLMVQGWLEGKTSLSMDAPAGLRALPNPYDPKANAPFRGTLFYGPRVHDLSYYGGKLYAYFSPVPAVLAFLPFHLITGRWLSHQQACLLFCLGSFLAAVRLSRSMRDRFFAGAGEGSFATVVLALGFLSLGPMLLQRPDVWEVPIACESAAWMLALLCVLRAVSGPGVGWRLALMAGVCAALAAGSRPSSALCALILLGPAARALRTGGARALGVIAALALPSVALGAALLAYNHARFGEWLEFGQKYQLNADAYRYTSADVFRLAFLPYNLGLYAFHFRGLTTHFPFVGAMTMPPAPSAAYGHVDNLVGMVPHLPAVLFALMPLLAWRWVAPGERRAFLVAVGTVATAGLAIAVPLLLYFGACLRYEFEFAMFLAILAGLGYLSAEASLTGWARCAVRGAWLVLLGASIAFSLLLTVSLRAATLEVHGNADLAKGNEAEAVGHFNKALRLQANLVSARAMLGVVHMQERDYAAAAADYSRAIRDDPDSAVLLSNYGFCLVQLGRLKEAIAALEHAVRIEPDAPQNRALLNYARRRLSEGQGAVD